MSNDDTDEPEDLPVTANADFDAGLRMGIAAQMGQSGFQDRDRFEVFGWPEDPSPEFYLALYLRNGYARTVVDKPAFTTWRDDPRIKDEADQDSQTQFESEVEKLARNKDIWSYCERADRCAGIGEHGGLVLALSDVTDTDKDVWATDARNQEFSSLDDLKTLKPVTQAQIDEIDWGGIGSERWGKPEYYHIDFSDDVDGDGDEESIYKVHWTRVIDIPATRLLDDETKARPRMEPVLNNLLDIEKTRGSAAEQSYRGADYGLHFNVDPDKVDSSSDVASDLGEEAQAYYHNLQPWLRTVGTDVERLGGEMQDPTAILEANLDEISAQTGIPKKELRGNESGEVAGAEADEKSFLGNMSQRQIQYNTPHIVRSSLDRLRELGILADPEGPWYDVEWPDLHELSESDEADNQAKRSQVLKNAETALPGLTGERAEEYIETGEFPEREDVSGNVDEDDPRVVESFHDQFDIDGSD